MAIVYANIGSNLGNRAELIGSAVKMICNRFGVCCQSEFIESDPWGFESDRRFLNLGVSFNSGLEPEELLDALQEIEKRICADSHRDEKGGYKDRKIDIDIMAIEGVCFRSERLTIPHRHLKEREFFLRPLLELNPDFKFPDDNEAQEGKENT